jgi:hypothetical protein
MWTILHILCCQWYTVFSFSYWEKILHEMPSFAFRWDVPVVLIGSQELLM